MRIKVKRVQMEKRVIGIILVILGVAGLITAAIYFMNSGEGMRKVKTIITCTILGAIFFSAGIGLIRNTSDKAT